MLYRNKDSTIEKGRWSSVKTARIYLKESIAVYNSLSQPVQQLAYFNQLLQAMLTCLFGSASSGNRGGLKGDLPSVSLVRALEALSASSARLAPSGRSLPLSFTFSKDASFSGFDQFLMSDEKKAHATAAYTDTGHGLLGCVCHDSMVSTTSWHSSSSAL